MSTVKKDIFPFLKDEALRKCSVEMEKVLTFLRFSTNDDLENIIFIMCDRKKDGSLTDSSRRLPGKGQISKPIKEIFRNEIKKLIKAFSLKKSPKVLNQRLNRPLVDKIIIELEDYLGSVAKEILKTREATKGDQLITAAKARHQLIANMINWRLNLAWTNFTNTEIKISSFTAKDIKTAYFRIPTT